MNKYIKSVLLLGIILIFESIPFLYNEAYLIKDMKWGWIFGMPVVLLIWSAYQEKTKNEES